MRNSKIIIPQSKQKGEVIFESDIIFDLMNFFGSVLLLPAYPFICGLALYSEIKNREHLAAAIAVFCMTLALSGLLLYAILNVNKLKKMEGSCVGI